MNNNNHSESLKEKLARYFIRKYRPSIVGVTGAANITLAKEIVYIALKEARKTKTGNDFVKTIIGDKPVKKILTRGDYPEMLLLEYPAYPPGKIRQLLKIARPQMAVIINADNIPEGVTREELRLIEALPAAGFAVINYDNDDIMAMQEKTRAHITTFGFNDGAQVKISNFVNRSEQLPTGQWKPAGISFKLEYENNFVPIKLDGVFGKTYAYAIASATAVGLSFGINLVRITEAIHHHQLPRQSMKLVSGIKGSFIIDDIGDAYPLSMKSALETVGDLKASRKVAVLGDMLGLGKHSVLAHESISDYCKGNIDILIAIGSRAKFIADSAVKNGFTKSKVLSFDSADLAKLEVQGLLKKGDLVLIKGSSEMKLEKIIQEIKCQ